MESEIRARHKYLGNRRNPRVELDSFDKFHVIISLLL